MTDQIRVAVGAFQLEVPMVGCQPRIEHFRNRDAPITEDERAWRLLAAMAGIALDANAEEAFFRQVRSPDGWFDHLRWRYGGQASDPLRPRQAQGRDASRSALRALSLQP